ncbi:MAG: PAS domain S-box protein [Nitrospirota bacterium]
MIEYKNKIVYKHLFSLALLISLSLVLSLPSHAGETTVRVGVYQNKPQIFIESDGSARGFYVDILEDIASKEKWRLEYVSCYWPECFRRLENSEIDLLVSIAYSEERAKRFDFTSEAVLSNWGKVYKHSGTKIQSIADLDQKTIAVHKNDIYFEKFDRIRKTMGINCNFIEVDDYGRVLNLIEEKKADAGVVSRLFGLLYEKDYDVYPTTIEFSPTELRFAVPKNKNRDLVAAIDRHLRSLKEDKKSVYYQSLNKWFEGIGRWQAPVWLKWALPSIGAILLLFACISFILRNQVRRRTAELSMINEQLKVEISERRRYANELIESEQKTRAIFDNAMDGILLVDIESRKFHSGNEMICRMLGYGPEEIRSLGVDAIHPAEDLPYVVEQFEKQAKREINLARDIPVKRKDGSVFYADINSSLITLAGRKYMISIFRDITWRKQAEDALIIERDKAQKYLDVAGVIFLVINADETVGLINKKGCDILGYPEEEITGKNWFDTFIPGRVREEIRSVYKKIIAGETAIYEKFRNPVLTGNGNERIIEWSNTILKDESGRNIATLSSGNDITEHLKVEEQLRHAQKMEALGTLTGGIAHDFNNILQAIIGYANLLYMKIGPDDPLRNNIEQILFSAERAANLTQGLLAFGRKQVLNPRTINLNEIIIKVNKLLSRLIGEDIELKTSLSEKNLTVVADVGQIEQVLINLVTNARDAMPDGGSLTLETGLVELNREFIETHGYGRPGNYALLSVADSGTGMDRETMGRIFEPFFTTKESGKGTGLGLSIVYGIIKQHEGYVNIYSEPGRGTIFRIYLPLIKEELVEEKDADQQVSALSAGGTETILVAEDDETLRKLSRTVLQQFGYSVIDAVDGEDAVKKFIENKDEIKLLIFDVIMPKKNGNEAYEAIKKITPGIKVIFISGYTADIIIRKGILEKGLDFIVKPVSPVELLRKVREVLDS